MTILFFVVKRKVKIPVTDFQALNEKRLQQDNKQPEDLVSSNAQSEIAATVG
jgi:hypothetical protein